MTTLDFIFLYIIEMMFIVINVFCVCDKIHTHYGTMHINLTTLFVDPNVHLPPFMAPFQGFEVKGMG